MRNTSPVYMELIDFIASGTTPEGLIKFRPSAEAQRCVSELIARQHEGEHEGSITEEEKVELDDFIQLEHLLIMAKAEARRRSHVAD